MYYEINVSLNGRHFFATAPRSITYGSRLADMIEIFLKKFPAEEGYQITVSKFETTGTDVPLDTIGV